jgi:dihydroorotate dehydrogenase
VQCCAWADLPPEVLCSAHSEQLARYTLKEFSVHLCHCRVMCGIDRGLSSCAAGAAAVQVGTAFLTTAEAGTPQLGRQLLLQDPNRGTNVTQVMP